MPAEMTVARGPANSRAGAAGRRGRDGYRSFALSLAIFVLIMAVWEGVTRGGLVSPLILPEPVKVWNAALEGVVKGRWLNDIWVTVSETLLGFAVGFASAIVLGAILAYAAILRSAVYPYVLALQTFPKIAIAPLLMAWFGYGLAPKVIIAALLAFFPVFSNTLAGFLEVDPAMVDLLRSMRATRWQELTRLRLPNAIAFIVPSLDVALVLALLGAVAAELAGAAAGLGNVIQQRTFLGDTPAVYAVLILLALLGLTFKSVTLLVLAGLRLK